MKLIPLSTTSKRKGKYFALVDDEDFEQLSKFNWCAAVDSHSVYATRKRLKTELNTHPRTVSMHWQILGLIGDKRIVGHADRNGLNNQRNNIRIATHSQNSRNKCAKKKGTSRYLGVIKITDGRHKCWLALIRDKSRRQIRIGSFYNEDAAARAYDKAAKIHNGDFANLNFKL